MITPQKPSRPHPNSVTSKVIDVEKVRPTKHTNWHWNHKPYDCAKKTEKKKEV